MRSPSRPSSSRRRPASISACARSTTTSFTPRPTTSCAKWWRGCGPWRCEIEDGNVSEAEKALRQAQDALRDALDRNASDEEIKKLTDQLRAALDKFMQALAEQMRKNPQMSRPLDQNTRMLSQQDLKSMIDRLEAMAKLGNKDAARQLLDQLQSMLENLQTAQQGDMGDMGDDDMMSALDELGDMIRKQQQLRDKTFKQGQDQRRDQQRGKGQQQLGDLQQDQQALRDRLNKLLEQLRQRGLGNPPAGAEGPGRRRRGSARQRRRSHGRGRRPARRGRRRQRRRQPGPRARSHAQGRAGPGAADAAERHRHGSGAGPARAQRPRTRAEQDTDPLGRPLHGREYGDDVTVKVPGEIDAQRARRILEELRKRFGEGFRPQLELDYIERLLKDF